MRLTVASMAVLGGALLLGCAQKKDGDQQADALASVDTPPLRQEYEGPQTGSIVQAASISGEQAAVWDGILNRLQARGLTVEHSDPAVGEIVARYSGDPEPYVDCGRIVHRVAGTGGDVFEEFPAARQRVAYRQRSDTKAVPILREMQLDGRMVVRVGGAAKMARSGNIRAEPNRNAERLATLPAGTPIAVLGPSDNAGWYRVKLDDGRTGHVADFLVDRPQSGDIGVTADTTYVMTRTMTVGGAAAQKTRETIAFTTGNSERFGSATQCAAKGTLEQIALQP